MLVNMRDILKDAQEKRYAIGSFSVANMECVLGVIDAAQSLHAPVILQVAQRRLGASPLPIFAPMLLAAARSARVPVAVHLDHGETLDCIQEALGLGFTSVMFDGSALPLEENLKDTQLVMKMAAPYGAAVETEVGRVGRTEDGGEAPELMADIADCLAMAKLGVDALAVGIGNAHGFYAAQPLLRYDILEQLQGKGCPALVLHGGTGLTPEQFSRLIALGVCKINIATDIFQAAATAKKNGNLFDDIAAARSAVCEVTANYITLFGSEGRAQFVTI